MTTPPPRPVNAPRNPAPKEHKPMIVVNSSTFIHHSSHLDCPSRFSWSPSPSLARVAHAFLLPLPICRFRRPFLETPLSPILLLLFVHLSLVIYPLPVRVPLRGLWVHVHASVWEDRNFKCIFQLYVPATCS